MKFYRENSSVENLYFSQSKSKAKIRALVNRKILFLRLIYYGKNSTMIRNLCKFYREN
ncbi:MAG: hypothetical protein SWX82_22835 [Cyanobacteriota bacterium]|nr:hypothetical protein [Cyanobacteriota bacterium]